MNSKRNRIRKSTTTTKNKPNEKIRLYFSIILLEIQVNSERKTGEVRFGLIAAF